jgi:CBS domain containing-hemolysin-like protein
VDSVGGLLAELLGKVPIAGSQATFHGLQLRAESLSGRRNRIGTVLVHRVDAPANGAAPQAADRDHDQDAAPSEPSGG